MTGVNKEHVQKVVYEMSKDSDYFKRQQRLDAQTNDRVAELQRRMVRGILTTTRCNCSLSSAAVRARSAGRPSPPHRHARCLRRVRPQAAISPRELSELSAEVERKAKQPSKQLALAMPLSPISPRSVGVRCFKILCAAAAPLSAWIDAP